MTQASRQYADTAEWLEADGLGGFASGTVGLARTRRYHALLLTATTPPTGRMVLVSGFDAHVDTAAGCVAISSQRYTPNVRHPDGHQRIRSFAPDPWPTWEFELPDGGRLRQEILAHHGRAEVLVQWTVLDRRGPLTLRARPFYAGRDYHALMHENDAFSFDAQVRSGAVVVRPYKGLPAVTSLLSGTYVHAPTWYRQFEYEEERVRGLDAVEDLASPGEFTFDLSTGERAVWLCSTTPADAPLGEVSQEAAFARASAIVNAERTRRHALSSPLDRAADAYLVSRGGGYTIVAGYPWFTDWGRDTFIALRGLCLTTGRLSEARDILLEWAAAVSDGMLPNRFPDRGEQAEFNSVDASLWYIVAVHEFLELTVASPGIVTAEQRSAIERAVLTIVSGYAAGTRFGIRMDDDGLLAAGVPGVQLTWMDAKVGDWVVTPRVGKPVEVQALWINALAAAARFDAQWTAFHRRATASFERRFWNDEAQCLFDVVDVNHVAGTVDASVRPNQIFAVGGLPVALIGGERARHIVDRVERHLLTPLGLRSLAPGDVAYRGRYDGDPAARDAVYHQGTVWPWLIGPFVHAWLRVRDASAAARREARERFLRPLIEHLGTAGVGHVSEVADGDAPFTPRGCPFQAWSLGEVIRLDRQIIGVEPSPIDAGVGRRPARRREMSRPRNPTVAHDEEATKNR